MRWPGPSRSSGGRPPARSAARWCAPWRRGPARAASRPGRPDRELCATAEHSLNFAWDPAAGRARPGTPKRPGQEWLPMTAGPEHDHHAQPGKTGLRAAWQGSRRFAVMAGGGRPGGVAPGAGAGGRAGGGPPRCPSVRRHLPPGGPWRMMPPGGGPFGGPGALGGLLGAVHGTAVLPKPGGGYQTVAFQNGKVTAVSSTSITLRSADGYSRTYRVTSSTLVNAQRDGIGSVKAGNQVVITATVSGSTATATRIIDVSQLQQRFHSFFDGHGPDFKEAIPSGSTP